ncbi:MAG: MFS transporter [Rhizobiales bacterium]|nr:MFS transporter [Hyphomicrobiales bacterium]
MALRSRSGDSCRHRPLTTSLQQPSKPAAVARPKIAPAQRRNVFLYYGFSFFTGFYIATGTTVLFEQKLGLSYAQIFTLDAIYMLMFVLFEVPSGALADLLGRKKTILAGLTTLIVAAIATGFAQNFLHLFLSSLIWSLGFSLISGSSEALLYDSLKDDKLFHRITGRALSFSIIGLALAGILGPLLFAQNFRLPYLVSTLPFAAALVVMVFYRETGANRKQRFSAGRYVGQIRGGARKAFGNRFVIWSMGALAIVFSVSYTFASSYQPYLIEIGFSVSQFAFILPLMFVSEAMGGAWSEKVTERLGETAAFWVNILALGSSLLALGFIASTFAVPILIVYGFLQGFLRPLASTYANRYIESEHRATVISVQVMVSTVAASALLFALGFLTDRIGVVALTGVIGGLVLVAGVALLWAKPKEKR